MSKKMGTILISLVFMGNLFGFNNNYVTASEFAPKVDCMSEERIPLIKTRPVLLYHDKEGKLQIIDYFSPNSRYIKEHFIYKDRGNHS